MNQAYRDALIAKKQVLAANDFVGHYAHTCLDSSNDDLLNDVPFVPRGWFRDWSLQPAGYRDYWQRHMASGIVARGALEAVGVWQIDADENDALTAEVYLQVANAFLFDEPGLDEGHWLKRLVRTVTPDRIQVRTGRDRACIATATLAWPTARSNWSWSRRCMSAWRVSPSTPCRRCAKAARCTSQQTQWM